jgi:hypothetical protein
MVVTPQHLPFNQAAVLSALRARVVRLGGSGRAQHEAAPVPLCGALLEVSEEGEAPLDLTAARRLQLAVEAGELELDEEAVAQATRHASA